MSLQPSQILIYHITDLANLPDILTEGGLHSDAVMVQRSPTIIGYNHIKKRRLEQISVPCCGGRFVGAFVPFYFCPRSPMLFTINKGNTGRPVGCQKTILHLVSTVATAIKVGHEWAISDGNAGAFHTSFFADLSALTDLDWAAIRAIDWRGKTHEKSAEFLIANFFPWAGIQEIGCYNRGMVAEIEKILRSNKHQPVVGVKRQWYY